ncbi:MAG: DedA family protein, partial [Pseudolabrys sp.]|nr:DedA family protein [Pseudolabrys sp.]
AMFGGGAYLFGEEVKQVAGPVSLLLLITAVGLAAAGILFVRHHETELAKRAAKAFPGPWS